MRPGPFAILFLVGLLASNGCSEPASRSRVIVVGIDGLDPDAVELLAGEGKLPNFARLGHTGASGRLRSMRPMLSPILWTTIATGRLPIDHGIGHFVAVNTVTKTEIPVTSRMRRKKALWNITSDHGLTSAVVGWWASWPAESIKGTVVSDHAAYHFLFDTAFDSVDAENSRGLVSPDRILPEIMPLLRRPQDVQFAELLGLANISREQFDRPFAFKDDVAQLRWIISSLDSYSAIGRYLWSLQRPSLLMVYLEGTDSASHLFGHLFRQAPLAGDLASQQQRFGFTVEEIYRRADQIVGEYLEVIGDDGVLIVLSDHGFHLGKLHQDPSISYDLERIDAIAHEEDGVLYLYGNGIRAGARVNDAKLLDIAPTVLHLLGLPVAADMPGRVVHEAFTTPRKEIRVSTFESQQTTTENGVAEESQADAAILAHLRSLGYLDTSSPNSEKNLAVSAFESGHFEAAARAFGGLIAKEPQDAGLRTSLAGALGALERYDEAFVSLNAAEHLDPLRPEIYHNRGVIFERQDRRADAIAEYSRGLRYAPDYRPSREALERLTGRSTPGEPKIDAERKAFTLAQQAQHLAQRGDYDGAWHVIQQAVAIAPGYVMALQYQSNIAYLRRDFATAAHALETALTIEPDNLLLQANLRHLREANAPTPIPPSHSSDTASGRQAAAE